MIRRALLGLALLCSIASLATGQSVRASIGARTDLISYTEYFTSDGDPGELLGRVWTTSALARVDVELGVVPSAIAVWGMYPIAKLTNNEVGTITRGSSAFTTQTEDVNHGLAVVGAELSFGKLDVFTPFVTVERSRFVTHRENYRIGTEEGRLERIDTIQPLDEIVYATHAGVGVAGTLWKAEAAQIGYRASLLTPTSSFVSNDHQMREEGVGAVGQHTNGYVARVSANASMVVAARTRLELSPSYERREWFGGGDAGTSSPGHLVRKVIWPVNVGEFWGVAVRLTYDL